MAKLRKRVDDVCAEAYEGTRALAAADPTDPTALFNAQHAIEARVEGLKEKIDDVWSEQDLHDLEGPELERATYERDHTKRYVFESWTTCRVRCRAEYFRAMWRHVERELAKPLPCSRCGAPLSPTSRKSSESVTCIHCRAANLVVPQPVVASWATHAAEHLAAEQCLALSLALLRANEEVEWWRDAEYRRTGDRPDETEPSKRRRRELAKAYYEAFVGAKGRMQGTSQAEQDAELARSLSNFDLLFP